MSITINTNVASLTVQRHLTVASAKLQNTFSHLSSGLRITKASDDAAGLAVADLLRANAAIAGQAIRNANDGISVVSIADGALEEIGNVLVRLSELASQSANGVLTTSQRSALSSEFVALGSEIHRISHVTAFNSLSLLSGSSDIVLQVGLDSSSNSTITISSVVGTLSALGLSSTDTPQLTYSINDVTTASAQSAAQLALAAVTNAISTLSLLRGSLGAAESRLNVAVNNLQVQRENFFSAESQIRDVDVASEAANLVRLTIVQQAATAVLAQANQQPRIALSLLQ